jgi:hypothetical protein
MDIHMPDASSVTSQEIKSLFNTLGSRIIAISFWKDEGTQALAHSLGAVTLLDKDEAHYRPNPCYKRCNYSTMRRERLSAKPVRVVGVMGRLRKALAQGRDAD